MKLSCCTGLRLTETKVCCLLGDMMEQKNIREIRIDPIVATQSVLIATARSNRPHKGEQPPLRDTRDHVADCPFCRGNEHLTPPALFQVPANSEWDIRIVENLYPLLDNDALLPGPLRGIQQALEGYGHHEVIIDHCRHGIAIEDMEESHLATLFSVYRDRMADLYAADKRIRYVLVFKNFGKAAGGSIPHTHSQLIGMPIIPHNVQDEIQGSRDFYKQHGNCIFCTLIDEEMDLRTTTYQGQSGKIRQQYQTSSYIVDNGDHFVAIKPFASRYEWEVHLLPIRHQSNFLKTGNPELSDLARVFKRTMQRLRAVVGEIQYNFFLHTIPPHLDEDDCARGYHWHLEICPRTAIPSGFELGSGLIVNSISPEKAAADLRGAVPQE